MNLILNKINEQQGKKYLPLVPDSSFGAKTQALILNLMGVMYFTKEGLTEVNFNRVIEQSNKTSATGFTYPTVNF